MDGLDGWPLTVQGKPWESPPVVLAIAFPSCVSKKMQFQGSPGDPGSLRQECSRLPFPLCLSRKRPSRSMGSFKEHCRKIRPPLPVDEKGFPMPSRSTWRASVQSVQSRRPTFPPCLLIPFRRACRAKGDFERQKQRSATSFPSCLSRKRPF